ncbi:UDP-N-acetylmuramoyl-tripeptide--D-alanyl-D-alanine ligase [Nitrospira sp. KM1]|uniref:UDP-N-acetylmuramoyl-tripeptide--D-alanyl-D- alanine ligase n=1 Tax=Nitrospira sp. KM1 TaxID=1936990 RepID=UPI0013A71A74|nr:UDP-N-acetylmuramoyl-tripeptide--D-alanyl-D-alanine ligase [Nitrospira sp. KM1]BCA55826.1 UDP-N-acetylmuramoyl-tripeptide--D-alanyl-D-alanine ligase [Nitrospira sp. KM1]
MTPQHSGAYSHGEEGMALFTIEELREVISVKVLAGETSTSAKRRIRGVATDSRSIRRGDLFVALRGERFDGHDFIAAVLAKGATGVIVHDQYQVPASIARSGRSVPFVFGVRDPLFAFQQLATHHRSRFAIPVVAVTGSNGKTTTKDMVAAVAAQRWRTLKTESNFNNRIGVPHTLLRLTARHQAAVIEMGVDAQGQTTRLSEIVRPTVGLITNIGPDHLEFFGSMEGSAQAKAELLDQLPVDGTAILNADDAYFDYLASRARCRVLSFGISQKADVRATGITSDSKRGMTFAVTLLGKTRPLLIQIKAHGHHNVSNALAAAAVGCALNLTGTAIAEGLAKFRPAAMRSQVVTHHGVHIINDCYNANPASMKAAIQLLAQWEPARERIAVLGDMLELGPTARQMHLDVGRFLASQQVTRLIACGVLGQDIAEGARKGGMTRSSIVEVPDASSAVDCVRRTIRQGDVVLVKASRGMKMEQVVQGVTGMRAVTKQAS